MPATKSPSTIEVPALEISKAVLRVKGTTPLIVHKWSEKAKKEMRDKQTGAARQKKEAKNPQQDFEDSLYKTPDGKFGFPSIGFKAAAVTAATQVSGLTKVFLRGAFHTAGELVEIEGTPQMREDMVRVGMGVADLRYRGEFPEWSANIGIQYNSRVINLQQLVHLFNQAGFSVGVGEWRPERDGQNGMFYVESVQEI